MKKLNIFLVGGALRDKLLGLSIKERDWVVVGSNFKIMFYFNFKLVGKEFPVFLNPINKEEYALARKIFVFNNFNRKNYFDFCSFVTLVDDLLHRDLTINSLVLSETGCLIDIFGGLFYLSNRFLCCISFAFSCDKLRVLRVVRFFVKYYCSGFIILPCVFVLIQDIVFNSFFLNFTIERVLKELFTVLSYKFSFLFFDILFRSSVLNLFFYELHVLFLVSSLFNFNLYLNFSLHVFSLLYFLFDYTNNILLKFSVLFLKLFYGYCYFNKSFFIIRYKRIDNLLLNYYKKKFYLSKKFCRFVDFLSKFFSFYNKFIFIKDCFIYLFFKKNKSYKYKIQIVNILLICFLDGKYNCIVNNFYFKYFILDILDDMVKYKISNIIFFDKNVKIYKKIIYKYKGVYNKLYFFL